ncbi:MAG TPA: DUF4442 domain-containing protein [Gemmatimonadales bacterium]|nr:DUF4442 domain-containing protein [Gemmatimonadales bacterium]
MTPESWRTRFARWYFNCFPAFRGSGGRISHIAGDWSEIHVRVPLSWRTRNYVGTIYGGSMYGAVDPVYMIMLIKLLGPGYEVWDKAATIRFRRPGRSALHARFVVTPSTVADIRAALQREEKLERTFVVELTDARGDVHAVVEKVLHIRRRPSAGSNA